MRALNLDQLQTLIAIVDLGTFAAAARALHLAPPTISLHIRELESRLGAQLLERGQKQTRPTPAGAVLVERARALLKAADDATEQVARIASGREGKVRLATSTGVLLYLMPEILQPMSQRNPGVEVELSILGSYETMERLRARTLDVGIVALPQDEHGDVIVSPWRTDPMMAFLPSDWTVPRVVTPQWLASRPLVAADSQTVLHRLVATWFADAGLQPRPRIELNFTEAIKSLVSAGYGAAVLPMEMPLDPSASAKLQVRPLRPALKRRTGLAHRPLAALNAATRQVLQALRGHA